MRRKRRNPPLPTLTRYARVDYQRSIADNARPKTTSAESVSEAG
jgi:hypothetical protein